MLEKYDSEYVSRFELDSTIFIFNPFIYFVLLGAMIQSFLLIWYLEFTLWVWIFRTISFENNLFTPTHPLHFIADTMVDPHTAEHRNNRIKIHILQMETQLQMNFMLTTNLYWNFNRCTYCAPNECTPLHSKKLNKIELK